MKATKEEEFYQDHQASPDYILILETGLNPILLSDFNNQ